MEPLPEMKVLNDEKTWTEIANILAGIQNGADAEYSEIHGIEKAFIEQETNAILTIVALKIFPKYLDKMKKDFIPKSTLWEIRKSLDERGGANNVKKKLDVLLTNVPKE